MNLVKELEEVLYMPNFMGRSDKTGVNLAVNMILSKIEELGFEIVEKEYCEDDFECCDCGKKIRQNEKSFGYDNETYCLKCFGKLDKEIQKEILS